MTPDVLALTWGPVQNAELYFPLAGGIATLLAVVITLLAQSWNRQREGRERQMATRSQFLAYARVIHRRLSMIRQTGANPIEGYPAFERLLNIGFSSEFATLVAALKMESVYEDLEQFEQAYGSMRYSFKRIPEIAPAGTGGLSITLRDMVEHHRDAGIAAAEELTKIVDKIRTRFGDSRVIAEVEFPAGELAPSVRRKREQTPGKSLDAGNTS